MVKSAAFALAVIVASAETTQTTRAYVKLSNGKSCPPGKTIENKQECAKAQLEITTTAWREESSSCSAGDSGSEDLAPVCKECSDDDDCSGHGSVSGSIEEGLSGCSCVCSDGYTGAKCNPVCADVHDCNNHGTASGSFPECSCACTEGYSGDNCETVPVENEIVEPTGQQQTQQQTQPQTQPQTQQQTSQSSTCDPLTHCNGHGIVSPNSCICYCAPSYTGERCTETEPSTTQLEVTTDDVLPGATAAAVLAGVLVYLA